jgi:hypothetical protein
MKIPPKGGRPKRLWDINRTIAAITQRLKAEGWPETEPTVGDNVPPKIRALYNVRGLCKVLALAEPHLTRLAELARSLQAMAQQLAKVQTDYKQALTEYEPIRAFVDEHLAPKRNNPKLSGLIDVFGRELFASLHDTLAVRPVRVHELSAELMNEILRFVAEDQDPIDNALMRAFREAILTMMVAQGFFQADIASILDPDGYERDRSAAMLRIRKELARLREEQPEVYAAALKALSPEGLAAWNASGEFESLESAMDPDGEHVLDKIREE